MVARPGKICRTPAGGRLTTKLVRITLNNGNETRFRLAETDLAAGFWPLGRTSPKEEKDLMLQAFIITLREGVEASLIVGIVFAYLSKIGRPELKRTVFWALGSAITASIAGAVVVARTHFNTDIFEGWVMLGAAAFVISMIWFMHKTARTMKGS